MRIIGAIVLIVVILPSGLFAEEEFNTPKNEEELFQLRDKCGSGNADACAHFARVFYEGILVSKDLKRARQLFNSSCRMGSGLGCDVYGVFWEHGLGGEKDIIKARDFYRKSCDLSMATGCHNLAVRMRDGFGGPTDHAGAASLFKKACLLGHEPACEHAARYWVWNLFFVVGNAFIFMLSSLVMWYLVKPKGLSKKKILFILWAAGIATFAARYALDLHMINWANFLTMFVGITLSYILKWQCVRRSALVENDSAVADETLQE